MAFWKNCLNRGLIIAASVAFGCPSCAQAPLKAIPANDGTHLVAVMPVNNLSGTIAPLSVVRQALINGLRRQGIEILDDQILDRFMARRRLRYAAGIDKATGRAFKEETGADAVLVSSVETYSDSRPLAFILTSRLVSTGNDPKIRWMDESGMAGDDSPGILGLGLIDDPHRLIEKSVEPLMESLHAYMTGQTGKSSAGGRFGPRIAYRSPVLNSDMHYRVAVVPFYNLSLRKNAGTIMSLQFMTALSRYKNLEVIDPGEVREKLLQFRIIMDQGISVYDADILFQSADVDLILGGTIYEYEDRRGSYGVPKVEFSAQLLDKKSREVVWSSNSHNQGDEGVFFFDVGRINTAGTMAAIMAGRTVDMMMEK